LEEVEENIGIFIVLLFAVLLPENAASTRFPSRAEGNAQKRCLSNFPP
jgi:hypothetical protein